MTNSTQIKKDCLWKQRTHKITKIGDSVWLSLFICDTVVCEAASHKLKKNKAISSLFHNKEITMLALWKHAYSNILKFSPPKNENSSRKHAYPVSILFKSIAGRYRPVRVADGPITARYRFIKNASWVYNFPLKPHFYIVKLGFTGVYIIFLISAQRHRYWYSLEPPLRGGSNEYPQSMFWAEIWKITEFFG